MAMLYDNQRIVFDGLIKKYNEYIALYREINHGSIAGVTPFHEFYWRAVYWSKYADRRNFGSSGY